MEGRIPEFPKLFKGQGGFASGPALDLYLALLLILVGVLSFILGRYSQSAAQAEGVRICTVEESVLSAQGVDASQGGGLETQVPAVTPSTQVGAVAAQGNFVASKSGKAYHLPWCPGAGRIKAENRVWFATKEEAEAAGYAPAGNCKGL